MKQYTIIIKGILDKNGEEWIDVMEFTYEEGNSILSGFVQDEATLHGTLNLKLISVNPIQTNTN